MANVHVIADSNQFDTQLADAAGKLVIVDFHAVWCGPCKNIAPTFVQYSMKYPKAVFLKVDVDGVEEVAQRYRVTAMPTFIFIKNKVKIDVLSGADPNALERMIKQHYVDDDEVESPVKGFVDLTQFLDSTGTECLNESDEHTFSHATKLGGGYLASDCDEQLIVSLTFNQPVKVHSLRIDAPKESGPKTVKLFINQMHTIDFDKAESMIPTQLLECTQDDLIEGAVIPLKFVKFQNVQNITVFVKDNQTGTETTQIDYFSFIGSPLNATNMSDFKRVAGKKGESH